MVNKKIYGTIAVNNRHVHLTEEIYNKLFDKPVTLLRKLNQVGEFACNETLTIKTSKGKIENVRLVGPFRKYNQVEILCSDTYILGINPPVRESGALENSETITLVGPIGEVALENSCIIAERHIHMNEDKAKELGLKNKELVKIKVDNAKGGVMDAFVKVSTNGFFEIHIDRDDASCFLLQNGDEVEIER